MKNIAFVTYNTVGDGLSSGWHGSNGRRALVLQNTRGNQWGARSDPNTPSGDDRTSDEFAGRVRDEVDTLWGQLQEALPTLDHCVIYLGSRGSERAIELAQKLEPQKVTFVTCNCGLPIKALMVLGAGLANSGRVMCECGGHETMGRLFELFMGSGTLDTVAVA